jgi:type II secretory pathway component PulF
MSLQSQITSMIASVTGSEAGSITQMRSGSGRLAVSFSQLDRFRMILEFDAKRRRRTLQKIAMYLRENVQLVDGLDQMSRYAKKDGQDPNNLLGKIYQHWANQVAEGIPFAQAIRGFIPEGERQLIMAAEQSGRLAAGINEAVELRSNLDEIIRVIRSGIAYPIVSIAFVIGCLIWMAAYVFPEYRVVLRPDLWPSSVSRLAGTADWVTNNIVLVVSGLLIAGFAFARSLPRWVSPTREKVEHYAPYSIYRMLYGTILLLSYAGFVKAGYNMNKTLDVLLQSAARSNPWYADKLRRLRIEGARGAKNLGDALAIANLNFPDDEIVGDLRTFAKGRNFDEMLGQIARSALQETIIKIQAQVRVLAISSIVMIAGIALWFISAVFDFQRAVSAAAQLGQM